MNYEPRLSHFWFPALLMVGGTAALWWSVWLGISLFVLAYVIIVFISVTGFWGAKTAYLYAVSSIAKEMPSMSQEKQAALLLHYPEIRIFFGEGKSEATLMFEDSGVDFAYFVEFMSHSNSYQTWAKRNVEANKTETRDIRRGKWDRITEWLYERGHLHAAPAGRDTYQWKPGVYLRLYNNFVMPYADLVGIAPAPLVGPEPVLYQQESEQL
jgi:hypothetical protein